MRTVEFFVYSGVCICLTVSIVLSPSLNNEPTLWKQMFPLHQALQTGPVENYLETERRTEMRHIKELNWLKKKIDARAMWCEAPSMWCRLIQTSKGPQPFRQPLLLCFLELRHHTWQVIEFKEHSLHIFTIWFASFWPNCAVILSATLAWGFFFLLLSIVFIRCRSPSRSDGEREGWKKKKKQSIESQSGNKRTSQEGNP